MTKHSTLTNADDLHYAKIRTFTGDPALIGADFTDQILVSADSNKIYRSTPSGLIELVANRPQGEGAGAILTGFGYPTPDIPRSVGALYFDFQNLMQYICIDEGRVSGWIATQQKLNINATINTTETADISLALYYSENAPYTPFNFSDLISDSIQTSDPNLGKNISKLIHAKGLGYYAFGVAQPNGLTVTDFYLSSSSNSYDVLNFGAYGSGMTANDQPIIGKALNLLSYPAEEFDCSLLIYIGAS